MRNNMIHYNFCIDGKDFLQLMLDRCYQRIVSIFVIYNLINIEKYSERIIHFLFNQHEINIHRSYIDRMLKILYEKTPQHFNINKISKNIYLPFVNICINSGYIDPHIWLTSFKNIEELHSFNSSLLPHVINKAYTNNICYESIQHLFKNNESFQLNSFDCGLCMIIFLDEIHNKHITNKLTRKDYESMLEWMCENEYEDFAILILKNYKITNIERCYSHKLIKLSTYISSNKLYSNNNRGLLFGFLTNGLTDHIENLVDDIKLNEESIIQYVLESINKNMEHIAIKLLENNKHISTVNTYSNYNDVLFEAMKKKMKSLSLYMINNNLVNFDTVKHHYIGYCTFLSMSIISNLEDIAMKFINYHPTKIIQYYCIDYSYGCYFTPLMLSCIYNMNQLSLDLIDKYNTNDIQYKIKDYNDDALIISCRKNMIDVSIKLIDKSNVNNYNNKHETALIWAIRNDMSSVAIKLIQQMDKDVIELWTLENRTNAWCLANEKKMLDVVQALLDKQ